jgi:hypothetical protein
VEAAAGPPDFPTAILYLREHAQPQLSQRGHLFGSQFQPLRHSLESFLQKVLGFHVTRSTAEFACGKR